MSNLFTRCALGMSCLLAFSAIPASAVGFLVNGGIDQPNPNLPPGHGGYVSPAAVHACYATGGGPACLDQGNHYGFGLVDTHEINSGVDQQETFNSRFTGLLFLNGNLQGTVNLTGQVQVILFGRPDNNSTGQWGTEMISMLLSGNGIMVRESPTLQSTGSTKITNTGGGNFHIDSFFDVFTELSLDGGANWIPNQGAATHVDLANVPEPATWFLVGAALLGVGAIRRRKLQ